MARWGRWVAVLALVLLLRGGGKGVFSRPPEPEVRSQEVAVEAEAPVEEDPAEGIYRFLQRFRTGLTDEEERELARVILREAEKYGCSPELVLAIIMVESSFRHRAVSHKGAMGLMQLRPHVAKALAREVGIPLKDRSQVFDPEVNVRLGLYYLSKLLLRFKDLEVALVAYNYGPTYVARRLRKGLPLPRTYVRRVMEHYRRFSRELGGGV